MSVFEIDYSQAQEFAKVTDGTYEVLIDKAVQNASQGGTDFLDIQFKIREDYNQQFKNNRIFHKIWINKETRKYPVGQVMNLAKQAGIPDGTKFNSLDDYLNMLVGKALKVTVKNETSEYNGKTYENLNVKRIEKSELSGMQAPEVNDIDLPF